MRESLGIRENLFMDIDRLAEHREELATARRVSLFGLGEPFLHPQFFEIIAFCKSLGVYVTTSSHGMSLKPDVCERILESGLDEVNVSMDGATRKTFNELRVGADFDTVVERVTALSDLKRARGVEKPRLNVNMTILRRNLREVPRLVRLAKRMGVQSVSFSSVVAYKAEDIPQSALDTPEFEAALDEARRLADRHGIEMSFWRQKPVGWAPAPHAPGAPHGCVVLWSDQIIERDGLMKLCCYIEEDVADVFKDGPMGAFNGEEVLRQRRLLIDGRVRVECQGCLYLRERTPNWMQAVIDRAAHRNRTDPDLTDDDRRELDETIATIQARKNALHPEHARRNGEAESVNGARAAIVAPELPVY
jgi:MoaA/NifB/PqqE/SkfB family radical SAM enzyme